MPTAWRLTKTKHVAEAFSGEGARLFGGRWNSPGTRIVSVSETIALAALEVLVHLQASGPIAWYSYIPVEFDPSLVDAVDINTLPSGWSDYPVPASSVVIGDRWVMEARSAVLRVRSAVIPSESNFLLNSQHPDFGRIIIGTAKPFAFDPRLLKRE